MYLVQKNITRLDNLGHTYFLNPHNLEQVKSKLKKNTYSILKLYPDQEKFIIYTRTIPRVILYEIKCNKILRHQDILGTLYSLNISDDLFGDVLVINSHYYVYILDILQNYFESNLLKIRNASVELVQLPLDYLSEYEREYEKLEIIVSSLRIDIIVTSIIHTGRSAFHELVKRKEITLNYEILQENSYKLKDGDTFSIKGIGKFKYMGIIKETKSNHLLILILKYK